MQIHPSPGLLPRLTWWQASFPFRLNRNGGLNCLLSGAFFRRTVIRPASNAEQAFTAKVADQFRTVKQEMSERFKVRHTASA